LTSPLAIIRVCQPSDSDRARRVATPSNRQH
jgi:hypothetical protein